MMKILRPLALVVSLSIILPANLWAQASGGDVDLKIQALEARISSLQGELGELKQQVSQQAREKEELMNKVKALEAGQQPRSLEPKAAEGFRLQEALGLAEESKLNIGGEINMRYRQNMDKDGTKPGFELYEVELFLDSAVNKNGSFFVELPIMHSNKPDLGNTWVDFHKEDELAATGSTGLMAGHFMPWFGYYGYDDNQSWIYGGRTTTNTALVRGAKIDSQIIRDRQLGIAGNLKAGPWLFTQQIFNGAGPYIVAGGQDNDNRKDVVSRMQYTFPDELGVVGAGAWYSPKTKGASANSDGTNYSSGGKRHVRDIARYALFFKYPNVMPATLPDLSLGGEPFVIYGEYHWGRFYANKSLSAFNSDLDYQGAWIETDFNIKRDKLVGIFRYDWFKPNADRAQSLDRMWGLTPGLKWQFLNQMYLTATYEFYQGGEFAGGKDDDRIALEFATQF